ncbi:hypothetical protein GOODEAATRI_022594, partial [Goodea atripinnis]
PLTPEPVATYVTEMPSISSVSTLPTERHIAGVGGGGLKPNGHKPKGSHSHTAHSSHSSHTHAHSYSSKVPGLGASSLAHMVGTMPGGTSLGISRAAETAFGSSSATMGRPFAYSSNTIATGHVMGFGIKSWDGTETVGRRKSYGHKRPQCTVLEPNQLHSTRGQSHSQHFLPTQPYFVTNSKTEMNWSFIAVTCLSESCLENKAHQSDHSIDLDGSTGGRCCDSSCDTTPTRSTHAKRQVSSQQRDEESVPILHLLFKKDCETPDVGPL